MTDKVPPAEQKTGEDRPPMEETVCRRCGLSGPVGDDGFCDQCEKALEQACL